MADTHSVIPSVDQVLRLHGPAQPMQPLVLDSPHSGTWMPPDFGAALDQAALRDGEDCFVDALYAPAASKGIPLLAAQFPRTYLDANRHAADIDPDLLDAPWPGVPVPSGKARLGKALIWRTLDDGRPIYGRRLGLAEVQHRIDHYHRPYHDRLRALLDAAHERFGCVLHLNCHSMNAVAGAMGEGGAGRVRADIVLGDRDGSTCAAAITSQVREFFVACGYDVKVNDPFKGVELVRAYADPARQRHSLQVEINKRLYMDEARREPMPHFAVLQGQLMQLLDLLAAQLNPPR